MKKYSTFRDILDHSRRVIKYFSSLKKYPYKKLSLKNYTPKSKKIFIFGTGKSILEINNEKFKHVSQFDSLGLNLFTLHHFTPDIYMFEYIRDKEKFRRWALGIEKRLETSKNTIYVTSDLTLRYLNKKEYAFMREWIQKKLGDRLLYHKLFYTVVRTKNSLPYLYFLNKNFIKNGLIHVKGSLSTAIDFAIKADFKTIVLCGVDLDDRGHFFPSDEEGKIHATNLKSRTIKIEEYLKFIFDKYSNQINFFISSKSSTLAKYLKVYQDWD
ncbi:hypothetical protein KFV02_06160 [Desulfohalobiaceae bacterium Ax17]|uniref:hypothetical protein n=1 Tax=Desulfovulcanus ferrireducens TaxID=2831190 RepID=UPI00207BBC53|nr:hypothetical protein [Desulfovulcanus ferrireducens]MBT8763514.1 hypothetical protein [Desulfovulcanus ferrireducens]